MNGLTRNFFLIECRMNHFVEINGCTLDAIGNTTDSIYARSSRVYAINSGFYNALQGLEVYMGTGVMKSCRGVCSWSMLAGSGLIFAYGTVPSGSRLGSENGQVYATNVTIDYGSPIPIVTPDQTTIQYATLTKSWNGAWRSDTLDVVQGMNSEGGYSPSLTWNSGCMWFGNLRDEIAFSTVTYATLTLYRKTGSGAGGTSTVYLCALNNATAVGTPSITAYYGAIGTIGRDSQVTFGLPAAAVQGLANGTFGGLCLYEIPYDFGTSTYSAGYMRLGGTDSGHAPYLTIVYN